MAWMRAFSARARATRISSFVSSRSVGKHQLCNVQKFTRMARNDASSRDYHISEEISAFTGEKFIAAGVEMVENWKVLQVLQFQKILMWLKFFQNLIISHEP